ncbi:Tetratricopeptide-like helical domain containing protein [Trema orientale]|uniref:Tetratricopeptide-like helical domain containing protein n=1 Tax=Trema orientale TaxID=63057 RepID=A0A2P5CIF8_TREOI|nr:Tetratricopeptide-like helical domain containing protein [Trema orientale]
MASLSSSTYPFPSGLNRRPTAVLSAQFRESTPGSGSGPGPGPGPEPNSLPSSSSSSSSSLIIAQPSRGRILDIEKLKEKEAKERKEEVNRKIASRKAISVILRREATKAVIEKKGGPKQSKKLLPRTVLESLHERISALRWESALKVFDLLREQMWYKPNSGVYIKLIVMLGKCKQPEKAHELFQAMIDEGCPVNRESYTALLSAYSRSGLFDQAFSLLDQMKNTREFQPDVHTYTVLIKSCLHVFAFDKVEALLSDMAAQGIKPSIVTYNTLIDAYGKARKYFANLSFPFKNYNAPSDCCK